MSLFFDHRCALPNPIGRFDGDKAACEGCGREYQIQRVMKFDWIPVEG